MEKGTTGREDAPAYKYMFPWLQKLGYVDPELKLTDQERELDKIIDNGRGRCGMWVFLWPQVTEVQGIHGQTLRGPFLTIANIKKEEVPHVITLINPENDKIFVTIDYFSGGDMNFPSKLFAETFRTKKLKAINAEEKEWAFGDHCVVEYPAGKNKRFYDPSFQKAESEVAWANYLVTFLLRGTLDMAVKKEPASVLDGFWVRHRAAYFPDDVVWKSRVKKGSYFFIVAEPAGKFFEGDLE